MKNLTSIQYDDTQVVEMPFEREEATQPMARITMDELTGSGPTLARSYSRDLEVRPDLDHKPTLDMAPLPSPHALTQRIAPPSDGVPVRIWPERARRLTRPFGSRGRGPALKVGS